MGSASILITDMAGASIKKLTIPVNSGINQYLLDVNGLKTETYLVKMISQSGETQVQKLLVQH